MKPARLLIHDMKPFTAAYSRSRSLEGGAGVGVAALGALTVGVTVHIDPDRVRHRQRLDSARSLHLKIAQDARAEAQRTH